MKEISSILNVSCLFSEIMPRSTLLLLCSTHDMFCFQGQVDASDPFPLVLERVQQWLLDHELTEQNTATYAVVTDGSVTSITKNMA